MPRTVKCQYLKESQGMDFIYPANSADGYANINKEG